MCSSKSSGSSDGTPDIVPTRPRARRRTRPTSGSRSLPWRRPIGRQANGASTASSDEAVALGMVLRYRHFQVSEDFFDRIHHHAGPADEVLMFIVGRRQMTREHLGV